MHLNSFSTKRKIYESLPLWVKQTIGSLPFSVLAGKPYRETLTRGSYFERASRAEILTYQENQLGKILKFATEWVPAYRKFDRVVDVFKPLDALKEFPLISKDDLQANYVQYLPGNLQKLKYHGVSTGGTSGNQLKFFLDDTSQSVEMAFIHRLWQRMGYAPKCRKATFRGVLFNRLKPGIFWQNNPIYNEIQFSPFHMCQKNLELYLNKLIQYQPQYLHGYPSAIEILAQYILCNNLNAKLPQIKAAFLCSEGCMQLQRETIEKAFKTRVFSFYGHSERVILAGECEKTTTYHQFPDYGILEIISENGDACDKEGDYGELVGTGLLNYSLPLIRYRTGDHAMRLGCQCSCGRLWDRFSNVEGHWQQTMIIGKNGSKISLTAMNMHGPFFERIIRYQYYQDTPGFCELRVMTGNDFCETDRLSIEEAYKKKIGAELTVKVCRVNHIALTSRGKHKLLDSKLV